jgi:hypothetical protein
MPRCEDGVHGRLLPFGRLRGDVQPTKGTRKPPPVSKKGTRQAGARDGADGFGTIQAELLAAGAGSGEVVELVSAYEPFARELAQHKGIEGRSTFRVADVLEQPGSVAPADIVILNRVVCCSPDGVRLTAAAGKLAGRMLLVIYPRDRTVVRLVMGFMNGVFGVMGRSFRTFLHPPSALSAAAQAEGLSAAEMRRTVAWEFTAFRRRL